MTFMTKIMTTIIKMMTRIRIKPNLLPNRLHPMYFFMKPIPCPDPGFIGPMARRDPDVRSVHRRSRILFIYSP